MLKLTTNAAQVAVRMAKRAQSVRGGLKEANRQTVEEAKAVAVRLSSARAHNPKRDRTGPYSRRHPHHRLPAFMVNRQSGEFARSWKVRYQGGRLLLRGVLYNDSGHAGFFDGNPTRWMVARPILAQVNRSILGQHRRRTRDAVRRGLGKR